MFWCCSLETSYPRLLPQSPEVCSVHLCLFFCFAYRVIITIFLNVNPWLIHVNVWQKPLQYCRVISLQLIKINQKKKKNHYALLRGLPSGSEGKESAYNKETWLQSLGWKHTLEGGTVTHFNILACEVSWTEEPGGLQPMGSERVGHDWATNTHTCSFVHFVSTI